MMAIQRAIDEVRFRIPKPILDTVFIQRDRRWRSTPASIDQHLLNEVIRPRVLVDCNLVGGTEVFIPLQQVPVERVDEMTFVYRIPKSLTQNRSIMSVLNITFTDPTKVNAYGIPVQNQHSALMQAGNAVVDAMSSIPVVSTAQVQLIGENVVMVQDTTILPNNVFLRAVLANDDNMSHLQLRSYRPFADLVVLAVKAYIYNEYNIQMGMGELVGGAMLGRFKDEVDKYADAEELYSTFLREKWQKIAFMNDSETHSRFIRMVVGGNR